MTNFHGAQCPSYPDCTGGCGLGCTHDVEARRKGVIKAVAYMRTSSSTNVGDDKDSQERQRVAILNFALTNGYQIVEGGWYYDAAVKGADPVTERPGFAAMLERIEGNGVRVIIVESPDRFARDLVVQLTGHDHLKSLGIDLVPASAPDYFLEDTPTARFIRQVLGAMAEFEKANTVAKLKAARDRQKAKNGKCGGRKSYAEINNEMVLLAKSLDDQGLSLRKISQALFDVGYRSMEGTPFSASAIKRMVGGDQ